ncbi:hypothetical protein D6745_00645 [Candidatus Woesearchaeota archaeon]|nr:MAG: hypothetical protein D6745_00645 [Candidatus Woesearchaeota archaeon]
MCLCEKCTKTCGVVFLIVGILFLLKDFGIWDFWNINWWTAVFLILGLGAFCSTGCPECKALHKKK